MEGGRTRSGKSYRSDYRDELPYEYEPDDFEYVPTADSSTIVTPFTEWSDDLADVAEHKKRRHAFRNLTEKFNELVRGGDEGAVAFPNFPNIFTSPHVETLSRSEMYKKQKRSVAPVAEQASVQYEAAERRMTLSGREYVGPLNTPFMTTATSASPFTTTATLLRPTDSNLFSWLSGVAKRFEAFKFHKLTFIYEPQCPTTTTGSVALWFDSDPTHSAPANWNSVINTAANVHGAPWAKHTFTVPPHLFGSRNEYYTKSEYPDANLQMGLSRTSVSTSGVSPTDPLEYFPGVFGFCSQDCNVAINTFTALGKVYLEYSVSFRIANVDSWSVTQLLSRGMLSIEGAENSGTSYTISGGDLHTYGTTLGLDTSGNGASFLGYAGTSASYAGPPQSIDRVGATIMHAGSQLFDYLTNPLAVDSWVAVARQPIEVRCNLWMKITAADFQQYTISITPNDSVTAQTITNTATVAGTVVCPVNAGGAANSVAALGWTGSPRGIYVFRQIGKGGAAVHPSIVGDTNVFVEFELKMQTGDQFALKAESAGANTLTGFHLVLSPAPFGYER